MTSCRFIIYIQLYIYINSAGFPAMACVYGAIDGSYEENGKCKQIFILPMAVISFMYDSLTLP